MKSCIVCGRKQNKGGLPSMIPITGRIYVEGHPIGRWGAFDGPGDACEIHAFITDRDIAETEPPRMPELR